MKIGGHFRTVEEINRIAAHFNNTYTIVGHEANEEKIRSLSDEGELSQYDIIHFATHAAVLLKFQNFLHWYYLKIMKSLTRLV